jgi:hypothetical protein
MLRRNFCTAFLILLSAGPAYAGPPLQTDDTGTPGDKHWGFTIAYTLDKRYTTSTHETQRLDLNDSVGDNLMLCQIRPTPKRRTK